MVIMAMLAIDGKNQGDPNKCRACLCKASKPDADEDDLHVLDSTPYDFSRVSRHKAGLKS